MRSEEEILSLIMDFAKKEDPIRAVLLTGSRADRDAFKDRFQDFDITYVVTEFEPYITDKTWIDVFGERIILQLPDEMTIGERDPHVYHFLMLFYDGNRIDISLLPVEKIETQIKSDERRVLLLDKDNLFGEVRYGSLTNYLIQRPTEKEFLDCCNEFWWVSTYVAKGLWRKEITYAKEMMDGPVRTMFLKMIEWYVGVQTGFTVSFGKGGRNLNRYVDEELYVGILATYSDSNIENIWCALFKMAELFDELTRPVSTSLNFSYNNGQAMKLTHYLKSVYESSI